MSQILLHYVAGDTGACKTVIAAELCGVAVSLNKVDSCERGMNIFTLSRIGAGYVYGTAFVNIDGEVCLIHSQLSEGPLV